MRTSKLNLLMAIAFIINCSFACNSPAQTSNSKGKGNGGNNKNKSVSTAETGPSLYPILTVDDNGTKPVLNKGFFVATKWKAELEEVALNNPNVSTVTFYAWWMDMNPSKGVYDWKRLDSELSKYVAAGRNCGVMIAGGQRCPEWIFNEGVRHFTVTEFNHGGKGKSFSHEQPVVYDKAYIDLFNQFVVALAAHMKTQSYWNKVTHVAINGINRTTAEFRLPAQDNMEVGEVTSSDATALWKAKDYDPNTVISAFKQITTVVAKAFPNRYLIVPVINNTASAFPGIGSVNVPTEALKWLKATYPNYAAAQYTALLPTFKASGFIKSVLDMQIPVGYELNENQNRKNTDADFFEKTVQKGIDSKALYIEVFPENVKVFSSEIAKMAPAIAK